MLSIMADALYGTAPFVDGASVTFGGVQVISQGTRSHLESWLAQARTARCRLFCDPPGMLDMHPHPWGRRGHRHRRQCQVVCVFQKYQTVRRGAEIRGRRDLSLSDRVRPELAYARHRPGPDSEVARRGVYSGLEVA